MPRRSEEFVLESWQHFGHDADVGVRGTGPTLEHAFAQAALAVAALVTDPGRVEPKVVTTIQCEASDRRILLVDFLNAVIFETSAHHRVFERFEVLIEGGRLVAQAVGEPFDPLRHEPGVEVKGATFTALEVRQTASGDWIAQCVVDV